MNFYWEIFKKSGSIEAFLYAKELENLETKIKTKNRKNCLWENV